MKATELMIGNWVKIKGDYGKPLKITTIDDTYNSINYFDGDAEGELTLQLNEIEPIPLTNEILEKSGFSCKGHDHYHFEWRDHYVLAAYPRFGGSTEIFFQSYKMKYRGVIRFVHQLQQALMFCEIEKEIVL